jgi:hypothetical protein
MKNINNNNNNNNNNGNNSVKLVNSIHASVTAHNQSFKVIYFRDSDSWKV